eukprot:RCo035023
MLSGLCVLRLRCLGVSSALGATATALAWRSPQQRRTDSSGGCAVPWKWSGRLFCDLDGVLTDFDKKVVEICGDRPERLPQKAMWKALFHVGRGQPNGFYDQLEWIPGGPELWQAIRHLNPVILSGLPLGNWAAPQKRKWCARELGPTVQVITCMAAEKGRYCQPGDVLIDDKPQRILTQWKARGGRVVLHSALEPTLEELRALGVLGQSPS